MGLSIRNQKAEQLARQVAAETGETLTNAIIVALEERLLRLQGRKTMPDVVEEILKISQRCASLPDLDPRSPDEILGYNSNGGLS